MSDRVLNFSEFSGKYSSSSGDTGQGLDSIMQSAANFEEGFDKETYDQKPLGPQRPIAGELETAPPQPGETGAPKFSASQDLEMEPPTEEESFIEEPEESEEEQEENVPEPEAGANPKKEETKMSESKKFTGLLGFNAFLNESGWEKLDSMYHNEDPFEEEEEEEGDEWYDESEHDEDEEHHHHPMHDEEDFSHRYHSKHDEESDDFLSCPKCGGPMSVTRAGYSCGCNM